MDKCYSMKISRIIKNRKAMTPLMIGLIVAASVIAVLFIVLAAVVPSMSHDLSMQIKDRSIKGNTTINDLSLKFTVMCDYADGEVWRAEIHKNGALYGYFSLADETPFEKNEQRLVVVAYFLAETGINQTEVDGGRLVFQNGHDYVLRVFYRPIDSEVLNTYTELGFTYIPA